MAIAPKKNIVTKVAGAAIKAVAKSGKPAKKVISRSRQAYDNPVSGANANKVVRTSRSPGMSSLGISENVKIKRAVSPTGRISISGGVAQVINQNLRASLKATKAEAKANARGLKAANKKKK